MPVQLGRDPREHLLAAVQLRRRVRLRLGSSHQLERSTNAPLERMTPPSLASKNWNGLSRVGDEVVLVGVQAVRVQSMSVPSKVMSVPVTPASVDRTTARLLAMVSP